MDLFAFLGGIGPFELLVVGLVFLLLFGSRLPSVMRNLGHGFKEFKQGLQGTDADSTEGV